MKKIDQKGIAAGLVVVIILGIILAGGAGYYFAFYKKAEKNTNLTANTSLNLNINVAVNQNVNANTSTAVDTSDWQVFTNNNYHYQISYPKNWYYIADAMTGPPPPASAFFASVNDTSVLPYASFDILVSEMMEETLDSWSEISSLVADGYTKSEITVSGQPAVRLERHTHVMDSGATIYVAKDGCMYRLVWGATNPDTYTSYQGVAEAMADSFTFISPLVADFTQTGTLAKPAESQSWYILWEAPGNPAINRELVFDGQNYISICVLSADSQGHCLDLLANGLLQAGDPIVVEGIIGQNNQVYVLTLTKQ
jgi:type II secretory pathway pseudopilin PulG